MASLTKKQLKALDPWILELLHGCRLTEWTIRLAKDLLPRDSDAAAQVRCIYGRKIAHIQLGPEWMASSPTERRHVMVHELIHCHLDAACRFMENELETLVGKPAALVAERGFNQDLEFAVDALAEALAPHLPLPPKL